MKSKLILIQSTDCSIEDYIREGLFSRHKKLIDEYKQHFEVEYYTSDILYYLSLILRARKMNGVIRVFNSTIPVLQIVKRLSRQPVILSFQYDWAEVTRANYKGIKKWVSRITQVQAMKAADVVLCTTERLKEKAENYYKKKNTFIIPNYVDQDYFNRQHEKENIIFYAGRLFWAKGVDFLINAFVKLKGNNHFSYKLLIAGDGDEREHLIKLAGKYCNEDIVFLGNIDYYKVAEYMSKARIYVQPTVNMEGHPRALLEAISSACACIATNVDGNRDIIRNLENGILVNPKNEEELYHSIKKLIENEELCSYLAENAYKDSKQYSISSVMKKEIKLLKDVSNNKKMRVVFLGTRGFPDVQGGVEKHCENLAVNLVKLGCEIVVFTRKPYVKKNLKEYKGVKLVPLPTVKNKWLEAMSFGLSCIVSDIPGNKNVGLPDENYFTAGNSIELGSKILHFINKPEDKSILNDRVEKIKAVYNWDKSAEDTLKVSGILFLNQHSVCI